MFLEPPLYIGVIMTHFRSTDILPVFSEDLYSSLRGWARLLLHCLRSIAGNSSVPPEEFCEIVFISSIIYFLVILISECICRWVSKEDLWILDDSILFSTFSLVWEYVAFCVLFCNFDLFLIIPLLSLRIWCFLWLFFGKHVFCKFPGRCL